MRIDCQYYALSSDLKTIANFDDYMLRLAAREDRDQYSLVSGLRENRMIDKCKVAFCEQTDSWVVQSKVELENPEQEVDMIAERHDESLAIELKSTLRPETLWEVYKRNQDIKRGVSPN